MKKEMESLLDLKELTCAGHTTVIRSKYSSTKKVRSKLFSASCSSAATAESRSQLLKCRVNLMNTSDLGCF